VKDRVIRICLAAFFVLAPFALEAFAEDGQGWTFSGRFQGSSNSSGLVTKADPTLGYSFSRHFQAYAGMPFYFVNESSTVQTTGGNFISGIGNAYIGIRGGVDGRAVNFMSNLEATAPTGDKDKGLSTGRATVDWTNTFSRSFSKVTPFASAGLANTVSDTSFFVRPFTTLGLVSHFDGGARFNLSKFFEAGASAYAVKASGDQKIFSKTFKARSTTTTASGGNGKTRVFDTNAEVTGASDLANDNGYSTWLGAHAGSKMDFQVGYTRSTGYDLNTVFFGVGFRVGK